jgi:ribosomal protein L2
MGKQTLINIERAKIAKKCAAALACVAYDQGKKRYVLGIVGLREGDVVKGNWKIIIERVNTP